MFTILSTTAAMALRHDSDGLDQYGRSTATMSGDVATATLQSVVLALVAGLDDGSATLPTVAVRFDEAADGGYVLNDAPKRRASTKVVTGRLADRWNVDPSDAKQYVSKVAQVLAFFGVSADTGDGEVAAIVDRFTSIDDAYRFFQAADKAAKGDDGEGDMSEADKAAHMLATLKAYVAKHAEAIGAEALTALGAEAITVGTAWMGGDF